MIARHRTTVLLALVAIVLFVGVEHPWNTLLSRVKLGAGALLVVALLANEEG